MASSTCPECGGPVQEDHGRAGSCPACMLEMGLAVGGSEAEAGPLGEAPVKDPDSIGPYRILGKLGEGGMGIVYLAEQEAPVRRRVALKVVRRGISSTDVIRRFGAERQALARMDHPSIARVFDAGETPDGLPYFVMEHVDGLPITEHCDRERLPLRERLELLAEVCVAVQHAHRKGVIHRDIKPSNVLITRVDGRHVPKVIDFGMAKAIEQRLTERSLFTELGMIVGTPEYMSPEQSEFTGERVDTRTDVYSLGVLQYELMTGVLPFDPEQLRAGGFEQICRRIREEEPFRPSSRVSDAGEAATRSAELRRVDATTLRRQLAGELDWVAMKALEKDPERRYGSPQELADDLGRYLRHEPVLAGPPSTTYRLGKFVRRNRLAVASVAAVILALMVGAVAAMTFALRESDQRRRAEIARADLEKVVEFQARMISGVEPAGMGARLLDDLKVRVEAGAKSSGMPAEDVETLRRRLDLALDEADGTDAALRVLDEEILDRAARVVDKEFSGEPLIEARLRASLASTYHEIGLYEKARPHIERSLQLRRRELGEGAPDILRSMKLLAVNHFNSSRYAEAEALYRQVADGMARTLGPDHPETLAGRHGVGICLRQQGRFEAAEAVLQETLEGRRRALGPEDGRTLDTMQALALVYTSTGRHGRAEPLLAETVAIRTRVMGPDHPDTLLSMEHLAANASNMGRLDEAEQRYLELLEAQRRVRGSEHPEVATSLNNLAGVYVAQNRLDEAANAFGESLRISEARFGSDHLSTISVAVNLASVQLNAGRVDEAVALFQTGVERMGRAVGADHPSTLATRMNLGLAYHHLGRYEEAARVFREVGGNDSATASITLQAAMYLLDHAAKPDPATAARYAARAAELTERSQIQSLATLARALARSGQDDQAGSVWREVVDHPEATVSHFNSYAWFLLTRSREGEASSASRALQYALKAIEPPGDENPDHFDTLALAYFRTGRSDMALEMMDRALSLLAPDDEGRRAPFMERRAEYEEAARE